jgi:hypothetical protein
MQTVNDGDPVAPPTGRRGEGCSWALDRRVLRTRRSPTTTGGRSNRDGSHGAFAAGAWPPAPTSPRRHDLTAGPDEPRRRMRRRLDTRPTARPTISTALCAPHCTHTTGSTARYRHSDAAVIADDVSKSCRRSRRCSSVRNARTGTPQRQPAAQCDLWGLNCSSLVTTSRELTSATRPRRR